MALKNLNIMRWYKFWENPVKITPIEIIIILIKIIFFLPILSAYDANNKAPIAIPRIPELKTIPSASDAISQWFLESIVERTLTISM